MVWSQVTVIRSSANLFPHSPISARCILGRNQWRHQISGEILTLSSSVRSACPTFKYNVRILSKRFRERRHRPINIKYIFRSAILNWRHYAARNPQILVNVSIITQRSLLGPLFRYKLINSGDCLDIIRASMWQVWPNDILKIPETATRKHAASLNRPLKQRVPAVRRFARV